MKKERLAGTLLLPASFLCLYQATEVKADDKSDSSLLRTAEVTESPQAKEGQSEKTAPVASSQFQMAATNNGLAPINMAATNNGILPKVTEPVTIAVARTSESSYELTVSGVSEEVTDLVLPIWSEASGQDDLAWYKGVKLADGSYKVSLALETHHGVTGQYQTIVYGKNASGQLMTLGNNSLTIGAVMQELKSSLRKIAANQYQLSLGQVPSTATHLDVVVGLEGSEGYSHRYQATKQTDGTYTSSIDLKHHQYQGGSYQVTLYEGGRQLPHQPLILAITETVKSDVRLTVTKHEPNKGLLTLEISEDDLTRDAVSAKVAVWSEPNQTNLSWYEVPKIDGKAMVTINQTKHGRKVGDYHVQVYTTYADGQVISSDLGTYRLSATYHRSASQGDYQAINQVIFLDAGHGGTDPGAVYYGMTEKALNLSIQRLVKQKLEAAGYSVLTARSQDGTVGLVERSRMANATNADLFVSIHFNASTATHINGIETYWYQYFPEYQPAINGVYHNHYDRLERSRFLANAIQLGTVSQTGAVDRGVHRRTFAVLRETTAPAVLLELGYMSNPGEAQRLSNPVYQDKLANGIVSGILAYYTKYSMV